MPDYIPASRIRRFFAWYLDMFIIGIICTLPAFTLIDFENGTHLGQSIALFLLLLTVSMLIFFGKDSVNGASVGKYFFGIGVRDATDQKTVPSIGKLFLRNLTLAIWPIEAGMLIFNKDKKRLGDLLANTQVVKTGKIQGAGIGIFAILLLATLVGSISLILKDSAAYKAATTMIATDAGIKAEIGQVNSFGMFPSGNVSIVNGNGNALLKLTAHATKGNFDFVVKLSKIPGQDWQVEKYKMAKARSKG